MTELLLSASEALARNDAERLEEMCAFVTTAAGNHELPVPQDRHKDLTEDERSAMRTAVLAFRRQVMAARGNLILRERLLATRYEDIARQQIVRQESAGQRIAATDRN